MNVNPKTEDEWLQLFKDYLKDNRAYPYACSWWIRLSTDIPTAKINYHLSKLCKKGILTKETKKYATIFHLNHQHPHQ